MAVIKVHDKSFETYLSEETILQRVKEILLKGITQPMIKSRELSRLSVNVDIPKLIIGHTHEPRQNATHPDDKSNSITSVNSGSGVASVRNRPCSL